MIWRLRVPNLAEKCNSCVLFFQLTAAPSALAEARNHCRRAGRPLLAPVPSLAVQAAGPGLLRRREGGSPGAGGTPRLAASAFPSPLPALPAPRAPAASSPAVPRPGPTATQRRAVLPAEALCCRPCRGAVPPSLLRREDGAGRGARRCGTPPLPGSGGSHRERGRSAPGQRRAEPAGRDGRGQPPAPLRVPARRESEAGPEPVPVPAPAPAPAPPSDRGGSGRR